MKMSGFFSFATLLLLISTVGCKNSISKIEAERIKTMELTLKLNINSIENDSKSVYKALENDLSDPSLSESLIKIKPAISALYTSSINLKNYIDSVLEGKRTIKNNGDIEMLYNKISIYKDYVSSIKPDLQNSLKSVPLIPGDDDTMNLSTREYFKTHFFGNNQAEEVQLNLYQLKSRVQHFENVAVHFLFSRYCQPVIIRDDFYMSLITASASTLKPKDKLSITAGVGAFTGSIKPVVKIAGNNVELKNGVAVKSIIVASEPGTYDVPVEMTFKKPDGTIQTNKNFVRYYVKQ